MRYRRGELRCCVRLALAFLLCWTLQAPLAPPLAVARQQAGPGESWSGMLEAKQSNQAKAPRISERDTAEQKLTKSEASARKEDQAGGSSMEEKQRMLQSDVETILASAYRLEPPEYRIIVEVESASLLWEIDKEHAHSVLAGAFDRVRAVQPDRGAVKTASIPREKLKLWVLRKAARLDSNLVTELLAKDDGAGESRSVVANDWSDEGRAILAAAFDQIDRDPAAASRLAQQSLAFGLADLPGFLRQLSASDKRLAEQQAMSFIGRLRDSSASPFFLLNFQSFVLTKNTSASLRDAYFEALAFRLRRDITNESPTREIEELLQAARAAAQMARGFARWESEFIQIIAEFERRLTTRSQAIPGPIRRIAVDFPDLIATESDSREVAEAALRAAAITNPKARDTEYRELAVRAAMKADVRLAEDLLSRIDDDELRRITSVAVYSPLVRRALRDANVIQASGYVLKISHSLGRSLVVDSMARSIQNKEALKDLYDGALSRSERDPRSQSAVKAALILAKSMLTAKAARSFEALSWAVYAMNNCAETLSLIESSETPREVQIWVGLPSGMHRSEEVLETTELIGQVFRDFGWLDGRQAQAWAMALSARSISPCLPLRAVNH